MYSILRRILFFLPAETAHHVSMKGFKMVCAVPFFRHLVRQFFAYPHSIATSLFGLQFSNKVGLGAGFDKNAKYLRELETLGFGFVEIGTVTPRPQAGNDRPRLFRLTKDKALINRMGFNNDGVEAVAGRLKKWKNKSLRFTSHRSSIADANNANAQTLHPKLLIGGNIGKNKNTPNQEAWKDYQICFETLHPYVDFFVVNVSSPNTPGLRELQEKAALQKILTHLQQLNKNWNPQKPILLKIAPDLTTEQIDDVIDLAKEINLDGLVATNTTIDRGGLKTTNDALQTIGAGGLSGRPLAKKSTEVIAYITQKTGGTIPIIGSGGISTGSDAKEKLAAGASLIEVWTGFIYQGPFIVKRICKYLHTMGE